jgi:hypothetical protein
MASCCLSATGVRFSVILCPPRNPALLTVGLPDVCPDPDGVSAFRTHELRSGWAPSVPRGQRCSSRTRATSRPAPAASQRPVPAPRHPSHRRGSRLTRHQPRVHTCSPVRSSPACGHPDGTGRPWAQASGFAPRRPRARRRTPRWGQAIEHGPGTTAQLTSVDLQSGSSLVTCDLASHKATQSSGPRDRRPRRTMTQVGGVTAPDAIRSGVLERVACLSRLPCPCPLYLLRRIRADQHQRSPRNEESRVEFPASALTKTLQRWVSPAGLTHTSRSARIDGGHGKLPIGGHRISPLVATVSPYGWPRFLPTVLS